MCPLSLSFRVPQGSLRTWALLFFTALLTACGLPKDKARIEGSFKHLRQAEFLLYADNGAFALADTLHVADGEFSRTLSLNAPAIATLLFPNFSTVDVVLTPGEAVKVKGDAANLAELTVSGGEDNEWLTDFRLKNRQKPENDVRLAAAQFIGDHPETLAALALFRRYFLSVKTPDFRTARDLLQKLKQAQGNRPAFLHTERLATNLLAAAVQQPLPDFTATTLNGRTVRRADFAGSPLLVAFVATWEGNATTFYRKVRQLERAEGNRCRLLVVSLDVDTERCRRQAAQDSLQSPVVCDGRGFDSPLARTFGVRYVPGNLLVGSDGRIVARDVPIDELETRVRALH